MVQKELEMIRTSLSVVFEVADFVGVCFLVHGARQRKSSQPVGYPTILVDAVSIHGCEKSVDIVISLAMRSECKRDRRGVMRQRGGRETHPIGCGEETPLLRLNCSSSPPLPGSFHSAIGLSRCTTI